MKHELDPNEIVHFDSQLILHDFGNLSCQVVSISDNVQELRDMAEKLNKVFIEAGMQSQFEAQVSIESVPVYRWQWYENSPKVLAK